MLGYQKAFCGTMTGFAGFHTSVNDRPFLEEDLKDACYGDAKQNSVKGYLT
jgi:hypothetical protein